MVEVGIIGRVFGDDLGLVFIFILGLGWLESVSICCWEEFVCMWGERGLVYGLAHLDALLVIKVLTSSVKLGLVRLSWHEWDSTWAHEIGVILRIILLLWHKSVLVTTIEVIVVLLHRLLIVVIILVVLVWVVLVVLLHHPIIPIEGHRNELSSFNGELARVIVSLRVLHGVMVLVGIGIGVLLSSFVVLMLVLCLISIVFIVLVLVFLLLFVTVVLIIVSVPFILFSLFSVSKDCLHEGSDLLGLAGGEDKLLFRLDYCVI